jgi:exodeoxyribonuclease VII large subunit
MGDLGAGSLPDMTMPLWEDAPTVPEARTVSLVRLAGEIARAVSAVGLVAVEGEVHRPTTGRSGWTWFTLRDRAAQVDVKVPRANARRCRVVAGERVIVVGRLEWTPDRGQVHLVAEEVSPVGAGAVAAMIAEIRARLDAAGLLARPRRPIPLLPAIIGVVCGSEAAVKKDIQSVVADRFPGYPVHFQETTVSGPGAAGSIVAALEAVAAQPGVEVVIMARGGGDATSLLPWSSEEVCRAVVAAPVPVVSAIGHDGDHPLCDEVADLRCGTPSIAAAAVVPDRAALTARLSTARGLAAQALSSRRDQAARRLAAVDTGVSLRRGMDGAAVRVDRLGVRIADLHPRRHLQGCRDRLAAVLPARPMWEQLGRAAGRLEADGRHLGALGPRAVLRRGYAVVTSVDGLVLRDAADVAVGSRIGVGLAAGTLVARVEEVALGAPPAGGAPAGGVPAAGGPAGGAPAAGVPRGGGMEENGGDGTRD